MKIAVWFSCGAASAVAAKLTIDHYPDDEVRVLNNPILEEDEDNRRFLLDVQQWIGRPIEQVVHPDWQNASAVAVWEKRKFMSGPKGAPCTSILKKEARQIWETKEKPDWHVLGFTADEIARDRQFRLTERDNVIPVLILHGLTKDDCGAYIQSHGIRLPRVYEQGYPNANCIGCVKASSPTYWNHVRVQHPFVFFDRMVQSRRIGAKLVRHNGKRIYLDELPENAIGRPMKSMQIECGIFCEEKS